MWDVVVGCAHSGAIDGAKRGTLESVTSGSSRRDRVRAAEASGLARWVRSGGWGWEGWLEVRSGGR
jgi:hypothetical protein